MSSKILVESFHSKSLEGNPLGDPASRKLPIYLPPGYDESDTSYPVAYILVGFAGRGHKLMNDSFWDENIQDRMDRLIAEGKVQPMILVMPDGSTKYGGAQYLNTSAQGNYQDYILEIVQFIDNNYRTIADKDHRAIVGYSSGGFGALHFGMKFPNIFSMVVSHSGDSYFELTYKPDFPKFCNYYQKAGVEGLQEMLEDPKSAVKSGMSFHAFSMVAMAASYSPNPESPFGFDLPFDPNTAELHPEVWQRWLDNDPVEIVKDHADALKSLNLLFFDCGLYDEYDLLYGARILAERLGKLDIPFHYEEFEDGHRNIEYRYDVSLQAISEAMKGE